MRCEGAFSPGLDTSIIAKRAVAESQNGNVGTEFQVSVQAIGKHAASQRHGR